MPFPIEQQQQDQWCWDAVSDSVDHYFNPNSTLNQCRVAQQVLATDADCCNNPGADACNRTEKLQVALGDLGRLNKTLVIPSDCVGTPFSSLNDFAGIKSEIDNGRPVGVRIQWFGGTKGHFVVICAYKEFASGFRTVDIADPFYGELIGDEYFGIWTIDFDQFPAAYQGGGDWTATFLVKAKPGELQ